MRNCASRHNGEELTLTPLEKIQSRPLPFAVLMGVTFTEALQDRVTATMLVREDLCTLGSIIHGGAIIAFADTVGAAATPVHRGRRTQVWQTRIETAEGKLVAVMTQTQMVL